MLNHSLDGSFQWSLVRPGAGMKSLSLGSIDQPPKDLWENNKLTTERARRWSMEM